MVIVNGPSLEEFELLSEKAFPEGHIDILILKRQCQWG